MSNEITTKSWMAASCSNGSRFANRSVIMLVSSRTLFICIFNQIVWIFVFIVKIRVKFNDTTSTFNQWRSTTFYFPVSCNWSKIYFNHNYFSLKVNLVSISVFLCITVKCFPICCWSLTAFYCKNFYVNIILTINHLPLNPQGYP